jgi:hypothetical protein
MYTPLPPPLLSRSHDTIGSDREAVEMAFYCLHNEGLLRSLGKNYLACSRFYLPPSHFGLFYFRLKVLRHCYISNQLLEVFSWDRQLLSMSWGRLN